MTYLPDVYFTSQMTKIGIALRFMSDLNFKCIVSNRVTFKIHGKSQALKETYLN